MKTTVTSFKRTQRNTEKIRIRKGHCKISSLQSIFINYSFIPLLASLTNRLNPSQYFKSKRCAIDVQRSFAFVPESISMAFIIQEPFYLREITTFALKYLTKCKMKNRSVSMTKFYLKNTLKRQKY